MEPFSVVYGFGILVKQFQVSYFEKEFAKHGLEKFYTKMFANFQL